jgi:hypothetical protein
MKKYFFASFKSLKKAVGSGVGSGSISLRYGSEDPDPHQNVTDLPTLLLSTIGVCQAFTDFYLKKVKAGFLFI